MFMSEWKIKQQSNIGKVDLDIHPVALQLLFQRGINTPEKIESFFYSSYEKDLYDPFLFSQMNQAVERIGKARSHKELVVIFGDYDADGITSSVIMKETLDKLGINCRVYIPDKKLEGYGLNTEAVKQFAREKIKLLITVDCGISNKKEIDEANKKNIDVLIIDHHHVPKELPRACAIINPKLENSGYSFAELAGVGVVFKVAQALYQKFLPEEKEQLKWLLDLAAIGTVADCVSLVGENRALVKYGLIVLSKTRRLGLQELFRVGRITVDENNIPDARKISFQIAPRINAAGRVDHANLAFNLIMVDDQVKARELALEIEAKNQERQKITERVCDEVKILAENLYKNKKFIFAVGEHFPIGVAGLVAGKIAEEFGKPAAVLQKGEKESKGSLRSIPQINIIEAIEKCAPCLLKFGGHDQAAGVEVANDNLEKFYKKLNSIIERKLAGEDITPQILVDAEVEPSDIDFELAEALKKFEPFGEGNEKPVFLMKNLIIEETKLVGNGGKHLKLFLRDANGTPKIFEAIGFNLTSQFPNLNRGNKADIVFNLEQDEWNGSKKIQLKLVDVKVKE